MGVAGRSIGGQGRSRLVVAAGWITVVVAWVLHLRASDQGPTESLQGAVDALDGMWWAAPAFVAVYAVRPLVLLPASLLTIAAGVLFGPVGGVAVAVVGANLSALVAFLVGRTFSPERLAAVGDGTEGFLARWSERLRRRGFATVIVLRLAFVPYDLVNYASGFLRIGVVPFLVATAIGSLPGTVAFVLAGASLDRLDAGVDGLDGRVLAASVALTAVSLVGARVLQRREARPAR